MRVTAKDDGMEKMPKLNTASKMRSCIKTAIMDRYKVNITDKCLFPEAEKKWKAFSKEVVKNKRGDTEHHEEIDPETLLQIYSLLSNVKNAIQARGTSEYQAKLAKIPVESQSQLNKLAQWGAILILMSYEVRRGGEGYKELEVKDFQIFDDGQYDFKYIRKTFGEAEKNNPLGSNKECHGVIPYMELAAGFNPGEYFEWYISLLPTELHKNAKKVFLFPKPKSTTKKWSVHTVGVCMFEQNMKGEPTAVIESKTTIFQSERTLSARCSQGSVRPSVDPCRTTTLLGEWA